MDESHRTLLKDNTDTLVKDIDPKDLYPHLLQHLESFSQDDVERINAETTRRDRAMMLLSILPRKGPDAFGVFVEALSKKQPHLHKLLMEQDAESCVVSAETSARELSCSMKS
ncbi:MAG: hypothetical protein V2I33_22305 [Kangiellaceae bacterium]|nr:hypothetical protein [Kangiellaceae bacterium]